MIIVFYEVEDNESAYYQKDSEIIPQVNQLIRLNGNKFIVISVLYDYDSNELIVTIQNLKNLN